MRKRHNSDIQAPPSPRSDASVSNVMLGVRGTRCASGAVQTLLFSSVRRWASHCTSSLSGFVIRMRAVRYHVVAALVDEER